METCPRHIQPKPSVRSLPPRSSEGKNLPEGKNLSFNKQGLTKASYSQSKYRRLGDYPSHFEVQPRYMLVQPYYKHGALILTILQAPTASP